MRSATREAKIAISNFAKDYFEEHATKKRVENYPQLLASLARILHEIQLEDIMKLGTTRTDLEKKLTLIRDLIKQDPILELDLARTPYELARITKRKKDLAEAGDYIKESIDAYQHYMDSCNDDSPTEELARARALSRRIATEG